MLRVAAAIFLIAGTASAGELRRDFEDLFLQAECQVGKVYEPYRDCYKTPEAILAHMDFAHRLRSMCPHPLAYTRFVQMAFDCSAKYRDVTGANYVDVAACFEDRFDERYDPANSVYCLTIENEGENS